MNVEEYPGGHSLMAEDLVTIYRYAAETGFGSYGDYNQDLLDRLIDFSAKLRDAERERLRGHG